MANLERVVVVLAAALPLAALFMLFAGIQRIPWRYGFVIGVGMTIVLIAGGWASSGGIASRDMGSLVLVGAIGGGLAVMGYERGKARRDAGIAAILEAGEQPVPR
jgi:hypothetical protein